MSRLWKTDIWLRSNVNFDLLVIKKPQCLQSELFFFFFKKNHLKKSFKLHTVSSNCYYDRCIISQVLLNFSFQHKTLLHTVPHTHKHRPTPLFFIRKAEIEATEGVLDKPLVSQYPQKPEMWADTSRPQMDERSWETHEFTSPLPNSEVEMLPIKIMKKGHSSKAAQ